MDFTLRLWTRAQELKRVMTDGADLSPATEEEVIAVIAPSLAGLFSLSYIERRRELAEAVAEHLAPADVPLDRPRVLQVLLGLARAVCRMRHRSLVETERFLDDVGSERASLELTTGPGADPVEARFTYLAAG